MSQNAATAVKILLVDDRAENMLALEAILRCEGLEILTARSGDEALELLLIHEIALAIIDVRMPEMDGFALAELIRGAERSKGVPIIFVTAAPSEEQRVFRGYDAGAVDFLFKPIEPRIVRNKANVFIQLYRQRRELEETLRLNEMFVSAISHDLRNPLNAMAIASDLILDRATDPFVRRNAERLRTSGDRMARMIEDLYDLARVRLGSGIPLHLEPVDLGELCRKVVAQLQPSSGGRPMAVRVEGDCKGRWDSRRLTQVLASLIGNALRHGTAGTPVDVVVKPEGDLASVCVHNSWVIDPEVLGHIFDPYRSREDRQPRAEGLGLGLFIVSQIVRAHGGTIQVTSNTTEGTTFCVSLERQAAVSGRSLSLSGTDG
jgi:two-component system sensor histidine kinase/response regulator